MSARRNNRTINPVTSSFISVVSVIDEWDYDLRCEIDAVMQRRRCDRTARRTNASGNPQSIIVRRNGGMMILFLDDWANFTDACVVWASGSGLREVAQSHCSISANGRDDFRQDQEVGTGVQIIQSLDCQEVGSDTQ